MRTVASLRLLLIDRAEESIGQQSILTVADQG